MNIKPDYQFFDFGADGELANIGDRMRLKLDAIPIPEDLSGKSVLDVGCDFGFWCYLSANRGASRVLGLDRNRPVKGYGHADLVAMNTAQAARFPRYKDCEFKKINLGKEWHEYGQFDVVYMFSLYHHIFQNCADHNAIWFWLRQHVADDGALYWENPVNADDVVVKMNLSHHLQLEYTEEDILSAAVKYFNYHEVGAAKHEPHRKVYKFTPRETKTTVYGAELEGGAGGATQAFLYANGRRIKEIKDILGFEPYPGSLNLSVPDWDPTHYYRAQLLDVVNRSQPLTSQWKPRWARFYPVTLNGIKCFAFSFEGENYPEDFVEIIADKRLSDFIQTNEKIIICH